MRGHTEPPDSLRGPFEVDRHRIIESTAFRRLEYKTQVFTLSLHDHFRTRLTHTLEVAQIARCLAVNLRVNEALCEAITLAHDLGHPPFGHAGETALNDAMADHGGFNHNAHSLRVVEYLEHPFPAFRGLNLTLETLAGLRTHATRYDQPTTGTAGPTNQQSTIDNRRFSADHNRNGQVLGPSVEARIASLADRIAYNIHDLEDAIGAGLIRLEVLESLTIWREVFDASTRGLAVKHIHAVRRLVLDAMLDRILSDAVAAAHMALSSIDSPTAARTASQPLVFLSAPCDVQLVEIEQFLFERVYRHPDVIRTDVDSQRTIRALFDAYLNDPRLLPDRFAVRIADQRPHRVICDYIAGMT
ncbi:MAG: dNTP triphosphohydrolase, partial [Phycisphaerales bacterium]|nr:dNTP triphosphohydrolase [Phycisphaerales bacterium]